ncbi:MAG: hypothetical protein ACXAC5_10430 [Promethearchaeota archaeon]|jgi:hypothetical protein
MDDCFDKILEANSKSVVMKYKVIIELMKDLENGLSNALRVRNCLIFLLNLSFNEGYGDYLDNIGKRPQELSESERYEMYELLKGECNN